MIDAVNLKIKQESSNKSNDISRFINDDVDQDLVIVLITLEITLFNRLLRYESVSSSALSYIDNNNTTSIQTSTILIGKSLICMISKIDMVSFFKAIYIHI
jgi:hypothetical protein